MRVLKERHASVDWEQLDDVIYGCANQAGEDNRNVARMALLLAGLPSTSRGRRSTGCAARASMPSAPQRAPSVRAMPTDDRRRRGKHDARAVRHGQGDRGVLAFGGDLRHHHRLALRQSAAEGTVRRGCHAGDRRERRRGFPGDRAPIRTRFAYRSQMRAKAAQDSGFFAREIAPVEIAGRKGTVTVDRDEHPRGDTTLEGLAKLRAPFRKQGGTVTAGNASGVNDGAAALIIASEAAAKRHGLTPRARVVAMATAGVEPRIMGIGPAPATEKLLERLGLKIGDIDVIELNEAFAAQGLAVTRQLGLPDDAEHVNPHGGAIALGHPLGMSGARLALTAVNALETRGGKRAVVTMCIGVGQGIAALIERV